MLGNGCNRSGHLPVQSQQYKQQNKFKNDTDIRMPVTLFSGVFIVNLDACWDDNSNGGSQNENSVRTDFTVNFIFFILVKIIPYNRTLMTPCSFVTTLK